VRGWGEGLELIMDILESRVEFINLYLMCDDLPVAKVSTWGGRGRGRN